MIKRIVLPIVVVAVAYAVTLVLCGSTGWVHVDFPSFLLVPLLSFAYMAVMYGWKGVRGAFRAPFADPGVKTELALSVAFFRDLATSFWCFGAMGSCIGLVEVLRNLTDRTRLGPNLAVAILTLMYAATFDLVLAHPFLVNARRKLAAME